MTDKPVKTWEKCKKELKDLAERHAKIQRAESQKEVSTVISPLLYRGQGNAKWNLETTLERYIGRDIGLKEYYERIHNLKPQIEVFAGSTWKIDSGKDYQQWLDGLGDIGFLLRSRVPAYDYMAYLRHHGFPSPLLDWTRSPFIAAFFAFQTVSRCVSDVSIYAYMECTEGKIAFTAPIISRLESDVKTHRRHFLQQSEYTICTVKNGEYFYASHEKVFSMNIKEQDILCKIVVPSSERITSLL